jgi:ABC-type bacteriocin/lantibiotic exporter with double-glycine peptidase domain
MSTLLDSTRIPFTFQNAINDCAPACVLAIADHYGANLSMRDIRERLEADPSAGVRLSAFEAGLSDVFEVQCGKLPVAPLPEEALPCIAYLPNELHYVTLWKRDAKGRVTIGDPALGLMKQPQAEFLERWGGIVVVLRPRQISTQTRRAEPSGFAIAWSLFSSEVASVTWLSVLAFLRGGASTAFSILLPLTLSDFSKLAFLSGAFFVLSTILGYIASAASAAVKRRFSEALGRRVLSKMPHVDRRYYTVGDIFTRFQDIQSMAETATTFLRDVPYVLALFVGAGAYLLHFDWSLAVIVCGVCIGIIVVLDPCVDAARSLTYRIRLKSSRLNNEVREVWNDTTSTTTRKHWSELLDSAFRQSLWIAPASSVISQLMPLTLLIFAAWQIYTGADATGTSPALLTILTILTYFVTSINGVYNAYIQWQTVEPAVFRLKDFLDQ